MKRKILIFAIIAVLLFNCFIVVTGIKIEKENKVDATNEFENIDYDQDTMVDLSYSYEESDLNKERPDNEILISGQIDLAVTHFKAWYSPVPPEPGYEDFFYNSYAYRVANVGDDYKGSINIKIVCTFIFPNKEITRTFMDFYYEDFQFYKDELIQFKKYFEATSKEKCLQAKLEIISDPPDANPDNNVLTVDYQEGITLWGQVFEKDIFGNKKTVDSAGIYFRSEYDDKIFSFAHGTEPRGNHNWFTQVAPKDPDKPAHEYKVTAVTSLRVKSKYTEPIDEMGYEELNFEFHRLKSKPKFAMYEYFERLIEKYPIFQNLIKNNLYYYN